METIQLELISGKEIPHQGYGAGEGRVITEEYKCPCGNGKVIYEKDDIPGFRESSTDCYCATCNSEYEFRRGSATRIK